MTDKLLADIEKLGTLENNWVHLRDILKTIVSKKEAPHAEGKGLPAKQAKKKKGK